ncbi:MAG: endonuclease/exonuclease/phosphatase family protein, partial [Phycisphaerae bacterium]|nr:endonuclease/exonuclease/phosphatase family protein [Phycisphaerae bacterium]
MRTAFALTILLAASVGTLGATPALPGDGPARATTQADRAALVLKPVGPLGPGANKEISGIVRGLRTHAGQPVFWTQNDSGDEARIYPIRADGTLITSVREPETPGTLIGGAINSDWEDIALLRRSDGTAQIIVPDFGNNSNARADLGLYFIGEPEPDESRTTFIRKVLFRYPDQSRLPAPKDDFNYDAEGLFTVGEQVFILSKNRSDTFTKLYRLDDQVEGVVNTLTYVDRFDLGGQATGADCSPDGLRLAVLTYTHVWLFERASIEEPFFAGRLRCRAYRLEGQKPTAASDSEAICFEDDAHLLLADETTAMLYRVPIAEIPEVRPAPALALPDPDRDIHVASFNVRYAAAKDGDNAWPLRRDRVRDAIAAWNADIIGMQEVEAEQADWLRARFPRYVFHGVGRTDGQRAGEFAPILFRRDRFEPVESGHFWLSPTPETPGSRGWDAALERMASWARLKDRATGRTLLVLNTHLDHRGVEARV